MTVFASKWLEEGTPRRAAALQQRQLPSLEEKNPERISSEPAIHAKEASEGFAGGKHSHPRISMSPTAEFPEDDKARSAGFLPLLPGEVFVRQINLYSQIFVLLQEDGNWNVFQETFDAKARREKDDDGNVLRTVRRSVNINPLATKINTIDMALMEASKYLDYLLPKS